MSVVKATYNRILRPLLPWKIGVANGVAVRRHKLLDRDVVDEDFEYESVTAVESLVQPGDHVVIVGGGHGVTAVTAARQAGPDGAVQVFEAFEDTANHVRETVEMNGVSDRVTVLVETITHGCQLPDADVLEIDCEGCEVELAGTLKDSYRSVIVEHHAGMWEDRNE